MRLDLLSPGWSAQRRVGRSKTTKEISHEPSEINRDITPSPLNNRRSVHWSNAARAAFTLTRTITGLCQPANTATNAKNTSFDPLKQIGTGVLNVGYAEAGPANGPALVLLHAWPYDIHSFVEVAPLLAAAGYRESRNRVCKRRDPLQRRSPGRCRHAYAQPRPQRLS
jgi:hypothetical protein